MLKRMLFVAFSVMPLSAMAMYDAAQLQETRARSAELIRDVLREDIVANLPQSYIPAASRVVVSFPERGGGPLAFWAYPDRAEIVMPLSSLRLFGDLSLLYAWFDYRQCPLDAVQAYMLRVMAGEAMRPPLAAFGLDRATVIAAEKTDPVTGRRQSADDLSQKIFSSAVYYILAHELAHIVLGHTGNQTGAISQSQEREADRFALAHFERAGAPPAGMLYLYMALWWTDPFGEAVAGSTHPLSSDRIETIARSMAADPEAFSWREPDPVAGAAMVTAIASDMLRIAHFATDEDLRKAAMLVLHERFPPNTLPSACP